MLSCEAVSAQPVNKDALEVPPDSRVMVCLEHVLKHFFPNSAALAGEVHIEIKTASGTYFFERGVLHLPDVPHQSQRKLHQLWTLTPG